MNEPKTGALAHIRVLDLSRVLARPWATQKLADMGGRPELAQDPRFTRVPDRVKNRGILVPIVVELMAGRAVQEWVDLLGPVNVPCGPVYSLHKYLKTPSSRIAGSRQPLPTRQGAKCPMWEVPCGSRRARWQPPSAAPLLGQQTDEVLQELAQMRATQIDAVRERFIL